MDIFVIGDGGLPNALYHNNGDNTFQEIAESAGIANTPKARGVFGLTMIMTVGGIYT